MRLFIALPVPETMRKTLCGAQEALRRKGVRGQFTPSENLHLTLCFLGSVEDPAPVIEAMKGVPVPVTSLTFDRLTLFGDVSVALFRRDDALERYAQALRAALDEAGIGYDHKPFRAHVTLARKTSLPSPDFRLFPFERPLRGLRLPVKEVRLTASDLSGPAPRYTAVYTQTAAFPRKRADRNGEAPQGG